MKSEDIELLKENLRKIIIEAVEVKQHSIGEVVSIALFTIGELQKRIRELEND